jgi:hypothetical protein
MILYCWMRCIWERKEADCTRLSVFDEKVSDIVAAAM